jgi:hypothetical protein
VEATCEVRAAVLVAEVEPAALYRERDIQRAKATERNPTQLLQ